MWWCERGRRAATVLLLLAGLAGCGFQFRSVADLPPGLGATYIQAQDRYSPFYRELVSALRQGKVQLTSDPKSAKTVIKVLGDDTGRRLLSVTSRNVPAEYQVYYRVRFSVDVDGTEVVPAEQLALTREYAYNEDEVLGKARQEDIIRRAVAEDLVRLVSLRLAAVD